MVRMASIAFAAFVVAFTATHPVASKAPSIAPSSVDDDEEKALAEAKRRLVVPVAVLETAGKLRC